MRTIHLAAACAALLSLCPSASARGSVGTGSDNCATPDGIFGTGNFIVDMTTATTSFIMPSCFFVFPENDVWFEWTASATGTATVSLCGHSNSDTLLAIWDDTTCGVGSTIVCNDNFCGAQSSAQFPVTNGTIYIIQIGVFKEVGPLTSMDISIAGTPPPMPTKFCRGDGTAIDCPCLNSGGSGRGCANSTNSNGASLDFSGTPSFSADTFVLTSSGAPPTAPVLFFQGTTQVNSGFGTNFGDGLSCVGGTMVRLGTKTSAAGTAVYPSGSPAISVKGNVAAGDVRYYQAMYRDADPSFCTPDVFNTTNGVSVTWAP
jgi:hypothetical protein